MEINTTSKYQRFLCNARLVNMLNQEIFYWFMVLNHGMHIKQQWWNKAKKVPIKSENN